MRDEFKTFLSFLAGAALLALLPGPAKAGSQIEITRIEIQDSTVFLHADNVPDNPDNPGKHPWNLEFSCGNASRHARAVLNLGAIPPRRVQVSAYLEVSGKFKSKALGGQIENSHGQHRINPMSVTVRGDLAKEAIKATLKRTGLISKGYIGEDNINMILPENLDLAPALEVLGCVNELYPGTYLEITQVKMGKNSVFLGTDPLPDGYRMGYRFTCYPSPRFLTATFYLGPWPTESGANPHLRVIQLPIHSGKIGERYQTRYPEFEETWDYELEQWSGPPEYLIVTVPDPENISDAVLRHTTLVSNGLSRVIVIPENIDLDAIYDRMFCLIRYD